MTQQRKERDVEHHKVQILRTQFLLSLSLYVTLLRSTSVFFFSCLYVYAHKGSVAVLSSFLNNVKVSISLPLGLQLHVCGTKRQLFLFLPFFLVRTPASIAATHLQSAKFSRFVCRLTCPFRFLFICPLSLAVFAYSMPIHPAHTHSVPLTCPLPPSPFPAPCTCIYT